MRWRLFGLFVLLVFAVSAQAPPSRGATVEGQVTDATRGAPLATARVRVQMGMDDPHFTKVDAQGNFRVSDLSPGNYQLTVQSPGFLDSTAYVNLTAPRPVGAGGVLGGYLTSINQSGALPPVVKTSVDADGSVHATAQVPMLAYAIISGLVTDPDGVPLRATVEIHTRPSGQARSIPLQVRTGANGEFRSEPLAPGSYWVVANKSSSSTWQSSFRPTYYPSAFEMPAAPPIQLGAGQNVRADIRILQRLGVKVSGHIYLPSTGGSDRYYTRMSLAPPQNSLINADAPFTIGQETYEFQDVMPGRYMLSAQTQRIDPDDPQKQPSVFGFRKDVEITTRDMAGLDITMQPLPELTGVVEFAPGCPAVALQVVLSGMNQLSMGGTPTVSIGADRRFAFPAVQVGRYSIRVESQSTQVMIRTATRGPRDILRDGLESPFSGDEPLKLTVDCRNIVRLQ